MQMDRRADGDSGNRRIVVLEKRNPDKATDEQKKADAVKHYVDNVLRRM